jgi:hypothetical protein
MAQSKVELTFTIKMAWWWRFYVYGVLTMSSLTGLEADEDKIRYWIRKAMKVQVNAQAANP